MNDGYGLELPMARASAPHRHPVRYLMLIDAGGTTVVRLFTERRESAGEFDAGSEDLVPMIHGLAPLNGATGPEWDHVLEGRSAAERAAAEVYRLDV